MLQDIDSDMTQKRHVLRTVSETDPGVIFAKSDMQHPMKAVFNSPMVTSSVQQARRMVGQTADVISRFVGSDALVATFTLDTNQGLQVSPTCIVTDVFKSNRVSNRPTAPNFNTCVVLVYGFGKIHIHMSEVLLVAILKPVF